MVLKFKIIKISGFDRYCLDDVCEAFTKKIIKFGG